MQPNSTYVRIRDDKVIIKMSLQWRDACDAEMVKRTKGLSSANGNEAVKQEEVKVKPASQNRISMMLQKQAQKQGAKAPVSEAGLGAVGGADAESLPTKRKPDVQVSVDDLLGSLTADTAKPKKKMGAKKRAREKLKQGIAPAGE